MKHQEYYLGDVVRIKIPPQAITARYIGAKGVIVGKALLDQTEYFYKVWIEGAEVNIYKPRTTDVIGKTSVIEPLFANDFEPILTSE